MWRKVRIIIGILISLLAIVFFCLYQLLGLRYLISAVSYIKTLPGQNVDRAYAMLSDTETNNLFNGMLAQTKSNKDGATEIWIWGLSGLRYFKADKNTIFSRYSICEDEKWKQSQARVSKNVNIGSEAWLSKVRQGDYVGVTISGNSEGGVTGSVMEAFSYDWWVFAAPLSWEYFEKTCKNR